MARVIGFDFGTTNTHIEYSIDGAKPNAFDVLANAMQVASVYSPNPDKHHRIADETAFAIQELIEHELIPSEIAPDKEYSFPHRTILSENEDLKLKTETHPLASFNIPFVYEKKINKHKIIPDLKWAELDDSNLKRIRAYFSNLLLLLRSKVLFKKGNLKETELIWFYPSSMSKGRKTLLTTLWNEEFKNYFHSDVKPTGIVESLAPYFFHKEGKEHIGNSKPAISIDIGGGTTDIVVYHKKNPILLTSFRFAANAVFGDGFSAKGNASSNGLVKKYVKKFDELLSAKKESNLLGVLSELNKKGKSSEINSFLFSVEKNTKSASKAELSYNSYLSKDDDFKIVFIFFYAALIYQTARTLKFKNIPSNEGSLILPTDILFSGTGSKILNVISGDMSFLANLSKLIFEKVYGTKYGTTKLTIHTENDFPKEVTCKGGLLSNKDELKAIDIKGIKSVVNTNSTGLVDNLRVQDIDSKVENSIVKDVESFIDFFITSEDEKSPSLNKQHSFNEHYIVSKKSIDVFKEVAKEHLLDYLQEGIKNYNLNSEYDEDENELQESLFFYPIIGAIYNFLNRSIEF